MVGWCQHNIWHQCCNSKLLGNLEVVTRFPGGPEAAVWHWLGRGCSNRAWLMSCHPLDLFNTLVYSHCMFLVCSNNLGVVSVANKGHTCSTKTNCILRHIYLLQAHHYIWLWVIHVPGCNNISNTLSREDVTGFFKRFPIHPWPSIYSFTNSIYQQADILEMLALMDPSISWLVTRLWDILPPLFVQTVRWTNTSGSLIWLSIRWDLFIWWSNLIDYLDFLGRKVFPYM